MLPHSHSNTHTSPLGVGSIRSRECNLVATQGLAQWPELAFSSAFALRPDSP